PARGTRGRGTRGTRASPPAPPGSASSAAPPDRPVGRGARSGRVRRRVGDWSWSWAWAWSSVAGVAIGEPLHRDLMRLDQLPALADLVPGRHPVHVEDLGGRPEV